MGKGVAQDRVIGKKETRGKEVNDELEEKKGNNE